MVSKSVWCRGHWAKGTIFEYVKAAARSENPYGWMTMTTLTSIDFSLHVDPGFHMFGPTKA